MALTAKLLSSLVGPQGARGLTTRLVSGTPAASVGNDGDIALDYAAARLFSARAQGAWSGTPVSLLGTKGDTGTTGAASAGVSNLRPVAGPQAGIVSSTGASTAGQWVQYPGQSYPMPFSSGNASYLCGAMFVVTSGSSNAKVQFSLRNYSTGAVVYTSGNYTYGTVNYVGDFGTSYPLTAGQPYCWYMTGTGTATFIVNPFYNVAATASTPSIMQMHTAYLPSQTMSSTVVPLRLPGSSTSGPTGYAISPVYALLYEATLYNSGSGTVLYRLDTGSGSSFTNIYSQSVSAGSTVNVGPFAGYDYRVANGSQVYWRASGSGTGAGWVSWRCWV